MTARVEVSPSRYLLSDLARDGPVFLKASPVVPVDPDGPCYCRVGAVDGTLRVKPCDDHEGVEDVVDWVKDWVEHESMRRDRDARRDPEDLRALADVKARLIKMHLSSHVGPLRRERERLANLLEAWPEEADSVTVTLFGATAAGTHDDLRSVVRRAHDHVEDQLRVYEVQVEQLKREHRSILNRLAEEEE